MALCPEHILRDDRIATLALFRQPTRDPSGWGRWAFRDFFWLNAHRPHPEGSREGYSPQGWSIVRSSRRMCL